MGMLAEQLFGIVYNLAPAELLRRHVALELSLVREFLEPNFGHTEADGLLVSLSAAEDKARGAMVFVAHRPTSLRKPTSFGTIQGRSGS